MPAKSRVINALQARIGTHELITNEFVTNRTYTDANIVGRQETLSRGHLFPPSLYQRRGDPLADRGGSFQMRKRTIETEAPSVHAEYLYGTPGARNGWRYQGLIVAQTLQGPGGGLPTPPLASTIDAMGALGWAKFKPTRPQGGVSQFLGELRQLPTIPNLARLLAYKELVKISAGRFEQLNKLYGKSFREAWSNPAKFGADDILNFQFGWSPLLKEVRSFFKTTDKLDNLLVQLKRDNGAWVRRRGTIREDSNVSSTESKGYFTLPSLVSYLYDGVQHRTIEQSTIDKWSFSGKFRYYIPTGNTPEMEKQRKSQLARIIYGAELSPRLVWQLTPWSWLADWIVPAGAVIGNLMDYQDGLVAQYAYVMLHRSVKTRYTVTGRFKHHGWISTRQTMIDEIKLRYPANPFGFGITWDGLSPYQMSIIGALGLSRNR